MRPRVVASVAVALMVMGLVAAPGAVAKSKSCKTGTVQVKVRGRPACLPKRVVLPPPKAIAPAVAQVQGAIAMTQLGFKTRSGKRAAPLSRKVGRSWPKARSRLLKAMSTTVAKVAAPLKIPAANAADADPCTLAELVADGQTVEINGERATVGGTQNVGGVGVSIGVTRDGGMQIGMSTTVNGDTYTMKYESNESDCAKHTIPQCPDADGNLNATGSKGKVGFSTTVTRDGRVLSKRSYAKSITVETRGKVADDAKLDYVDVKYSEVTNVISDGVRYSSYGNRSTRINMRSGSYDPGESVSFGNANAAGESINTAGTEADANDFSAFVNRTMSNYRYREAAWQSAGKCATLKLNPASNTLTLQPGATGSFSAQVIAVNGGGVAAGARWTLSAEQNGSFTPATSNDREPSFSYTVTSDPSGEILSVSVRATSTAGVAQETWSQKIEAKLKTVSGTFTGHATDLGVIYDWNGTATFTRVDTGTDVPGPGGVFQLSAGQATVTVSGSLFGSGCDQTGTTTIGLFDKSPWTVTGLEPPFSYQVTAPFKPDVPKATNINCSNPTDNGTDAGLGSMPVPALQSGDIADGANVTGLVQTTTDLLTYTGSASASMGGESQHWTWSMTGSRD